MRPLSKRSMLENSNLLNVVDVVIILVGGVWVFRRVAEMDRYHNLRVVVLIVILSFAGIYLFAAFVSMFTVPFDDCISFPGNSNNFY